MNFSEMTCTYLPVASPSTRRGKEKKKIFNFNWFSSGGELCRGGHTYGQSSLCSRKAKDQAHRSESWRIFGECYFKNSERKNQGTFTVIDSLRRQVHFPQEKPWNHYCELLCQYFD